MSVWRKLKGRGEPTVPDPEPREMTAADFQVPRRRIIKEWLDRWATLIVAVFAALVLLAGYLWLS